MKKNYLILLVLTLILLPALAFWHFALHPAYPAVPVTPERQLPKKLLLVPLDGRPPCRQFVIDAGRIAGFDIVTPPSRLQDYYSQPGDTDGLRRWLQANTPAADGIILSIDQLLYGGLLASREKEKTPAEIQSMLQFLRDLHTACPDIPIYAFSILPRQTPQDTIDGYQERKDLLAYSRLRGRQSAGLPVDTAELTRLKASIPPDSMNRYLTHFKENEELNRQLLQLTKEGVLSQLVLGQDDGEPYSIPNIEKNKLRQFMSAQRLTEPQVFLTHGADEIALSILAGIQNQQTGFKPRILVRYNDQSTPDCIMPYMAISTEETVQEKIALLGGTRASAPEEADFTLLVSANDADAGTMRSRMSVVQQLQAARQAKQPTALVDLSKHFQPQETILPLLIDTGYPLNTLIAYAGWNTTSNSVGTALAQASLFTAANGQSSSQDESIGLTAANLTFLQNRIMEDYFYLKEDIDCINHSLQKAGYTNTADLDLEHNWRWANAMLQQAMKRQLASYKYTKAFRTPVKFTSPAGNFSLMMQDMTVNISYPWPRTFEVWLQTKPFFALPPDDKK